jgi:hypothetical protein
MSRWIVASAAVLFGLSAAPAFAAETLPTPDTAAAAYYKIYKQAHVMDIPNAKQRVVWKPVLSDELFGLLVLGDQAERRWADKNKKEPAPPLYEGDLFTSMVEGNAQFTSIACETNGDKSVCTASLHYFDKHGKDGKPEDFKWQDKLDLIHTPVGWRVDDLEYGNTGDFGTHGKLKDVLKDVDKESRE